jgi:hypothetical protein
VKAIHEVGVPLEQLAAPAAALEHAKVEPRVQVQQQPLQTRFPPRSAGRPHQCLPAPPLSITCGKLHSESASAGQWPKLSAAIWRCAATFARAATHLRKIHYVPAI